MRHSLAADGLDHHFATPTVKEILPAVVTRPSNERVGQRELVAYSLLLAPDRPKADGSAR